MSDILRAIRERSSTRGYTAEKLTEEELNAILAAGLQAPTAANRQEVHISVVEGNHPVLGEIEAEMCKGRERRNASHNFYYEAPVLLVLSADESFHWGAVDAGIAAENIALAAEGLGLGSLIIGCIRDAMSGERKAEFAEALRFPEGYGYQVAVAVGHKAVEKAPHTYDFAKNVSRI